MGDHLPSGIGGPSETSTDMAPPRPKRTGTLFVIPPRNRVFAVFDDAGDGHRAVAALAAQGLREPDQVWAFEGDERADRLDPHNVVGGARVLQLLLSSDVEYRAGLADTLRHGGMVLAVSATKTALTAVVRVLRTHGGYSLAYRRAINFVPVP